MRRTLIGTVVSDRNDKTRRVDVSRDYQHTKYKKIVRGRTICYVHDEKNTSKVGDSVEIVESRPHSATKRWELVRVVSAAGDVESQLTRESIEAARSGEAEAEMTDSPS